MNNNQMGGGQKMSVNNLFLINFEIKKNYGDGTLLFQNLNKKNDLLGLKSFILSYYLFLRFLL